MHNFTKVISVEEVKETEDVYDIEVEETHCFFANGMLAHNCVAGADMHIIASHQTNGDYSTWGPNDVNFELIQSELKDMIYAFKDALGEENYYLEMQFNRLCIDGDAIINTSSGLLTLEDVVSSVSDGKQILVLSYNEASKNVEYKKVLWGSLMSKKAKVVKITLANGKTLKLTPDHKVYTDQGWVEAQDLKKYANIKILSTS
jgi:intein/homing endonuclease